MSLARLTDEDLVHELCEVESGLSEWEVKFVESLAQQKALPRSAAFRYRMTQKQRVVAERIYREKVKA